VKPTFVHTPGRDPDEQLAEVRLAFVDHALKRERVSVVVERSRREFSGRVVTVLDDAAVLARPFGWATIAFAIVREVRRVARGPA
jgi:hypothetical protein